MNELKVLSLFSGVGGFDLGLEAAGMRTVFQCEIDPNCRQTLDHHWSGVPKWDDVSTLTGAHILEQTDGVDVVAWGSPCQDLSVAGKRAGLTGERSGLFHQGIRIIKELRELSNGKYPTWSIWENVYGALSSNGGADFGQVLYEMDEAGACFSEWAVLDAQYFGVPQRRRRVFVVSCFDSSVAAGCPDKIFALGESGSRDSAKGGSQGKDVAGTVATGVGAGGEPDLMRQREGKPGGGKGPLLSDTSLTLAGSNDQTLFQPIGHTDENGVLRGTVTSKWAKGSGGPAGDEAYNLVIQSPIVFSHTQGLDAQPSEVHSPTLRTEGAGMAVAIPIQDGREIEKHQNGFGVGQAGDPSYTLDQTGGQAVAVAIPNIVGSLQARDFKGVGNQYVQENKLVVQEKPMLIDGTRVNDVRIYEEPVQTLKERMGTGGNNVPVVAQNVQATDVNGSDIAATLRGFGHGWQGQHNTTNAVAQETEPVLAFDGYNQAITENIYRSLRIGIDSGDHIQIPSETEPTMQVRRLTPIECERLMGWNDNHTLYRADGKTNADTTRYKMCGNGVASPVAEWIGQHLIPLSDVDPF